MLHEVRNNQNLGPPSPPKADTDGQAEVEGNLIKL